VARDHEPDLAEPQNGESIAADPPPAKEPETGTMPKSILHKKSSGASHAVPDYAEQKRLKSVVRRLEREQEELLGRLEELESNHRALSAELADPEVYTDGDKVKQTTKRLELNSAEQQRLLKRWEELEVELAGTSR
jgi:ATP-binding cassette subfamily F protein 3